jgi:co-chaperonin GroES (HSP10)
MEFTTTYTPCPGYILIDPTRDTHTGNVKVVDPISKSYIGTVVAVGDPKVTEYGATLPPTVSKDDTVLYSIAGIEYATLPFKDNPRKELIIAPFNRILLVINE